MVKGLEAMVIESFTAARAYGVEDQVLASLGETFPGIDWEKQGAYFFQRVIQHGRRRAEEMREAAATVRDAGLEPWSAAGTAERQASIADLADAHVFDGSDPARRGWRGEADRLLDAVKSGREAVKSVVVSGFSRTPGFEAESRRAVRGHARMAAVPSEPVEATVRSTGRRRRRALPRVRARR